MQAAQSMQLVEIHLHGFLGKKYGEVVTLAGDSIAQLMNGLKARFGPNFKEDIRTNDWHLVKGDIEAKKPDEIAEDGLGDKLNTATLHLVPVLEAAKKFAQIIVGAVLLAVGTFVYPSPMLVGMGWSMIIGGTINLLFAPKPPKFGGPANTEDTGSYVFNGAVNITNQGGAKPIIFGRVRRAGSVVISSDFSSDRISQNYTGSGGGGGRGGNFDYDHSGLVIDLP